MLNIYVVVNRVKSKTENKLKEAKANVNLDPTTVKVIELACRNAIDELQNFKRRLSKQASEIEKQAEVLYNTIDNML